MQVGIIQSGTLSLNTQTSKVSKTSLLAYHDPRDTNQDGIVSAAEERAYALKHPELALEKAMQTPSTNTTRHATAAYTPKGAAKAASQAAHGSLDLLA